MAGIGMSITFWELDRPPPPRYTNPYGPGTGQILETNNILTHPEGAELVVSEGTYALREDILLATPPPHPQDQTVHLPINPLATTLGPPTAGTKLSLTVLVPKNPPTHRLYRANTRGSTWSVLPQSIQENPSESNGSETASQHRSNGVSSSAYSNAPTFGDGNPALALVNGKEVKDPAKKRERKPKSNIIKSNSAFVSRVITHENLTKRQSERSPDGLYVIANINRAVTWLDMSSPIKEENLTKILFTKAHALCHDINPLTKSLSHIDIILGFSPGDIIWWEAIDQKYSRINKNGIICNSAVSDIRWIPNSENLFMAAHMDGSIVIYDKCKDDAPFEPEDASAPVKHVDGTAAKDRKSMDVRSHTSEQSTESNNDGHVKIKIRKSVQSRNQKTNPVAFWKISNQKVNAISFSPDGRHLAIVCDDGTLRVMDYLKEQLLDVYRSYYGGLTCVCWSPDGRYIVTGGQDDLISIWSLAEQALVARCQGHNSWVTAVAFDPWRCDDRVYRFGSVGEDRRLLLWDFSVGMLVRPRAASLRQRTSISMGGSSLGRTRTESVTTRIRSHSTTQSGESKDVEEIEHPVEARARTAMLPPVMAKKVDEHPLTWLGFEEDCIMTSCKDGHIRTWNRPKEGTAPGDGAPSTPGSGS